MTSRLELSMSAAQDASSVLSPVDELLLDPCEYCAAPHRTRFFAGSTSPFGASVLGLGPVLVLIRDLSFFLSPAQLCVTDGIKSSCSMRIS